MKEAIEPTETGGVDVCEACAALALGIPEPSYTEDMALCPDCEAYYGVADYLEGK